MGILDVFTGDNLSEDGFSGVHVGMGFDEFVELYVRAEYYYHHQFLRMGVYFPKHVYYTYFDSLSFLFSIGGTDGLFSIRAYENFPGTLFGDIRVGDSLSKLVDRGISYDFDDDMAYLNGFKNHITLTMSGDLTMLDTKEEREALLIEQVRIDKMPA